MPLTTPSVDLPVNGRPIVVLGMHRSGTSAVSGCLAQLGIHLGGDLLSPIHGENDKGFWEHRGIVGIHDLLLAELGSSWDDVRTLPQDWWDSPAAVKASANLLDVLSGDVIRAGYWGLKDPRMCRLLPLWQRLFAQIGVEPAYVLVLRHPLEVVASLSKRNGFSPQKSGLIYLHHMLAAERLTRNQPRVWVHYDALIRDPDSTMRSASDTLGLGLAAIVEASRGKLAEFVSADLRHHLHQVEPQVTGTRESGDRIMDMALAVYEAMRSMDDGADTDSVRILDDLAQELVVVPGSCAEVLNEHVTHIVHRFRVVTQYASSLEKEVQKLTLNAQNERAAFKESNQESILYAETLQHEILKLTTGAREERARFERSNDESVRYGDALRKEIQNLKTGAEKASAAFERSRLEALSVVAMLQNEKQKLTAGAQVERDAYEKYRAESEKYVGALEQEIQKLTAGAQVERDAYEKSRAESEKYVGALAQEIQKLTAGAQAERLEFEKSLAEAKRYVDSLEHSIRKETGSASQGQGG